MSCAKSIEMQFGILSQVGPENMCYIGCRCPLGRGTFVMSA